MTAACISAILSLSPRMPEAQARQIAVAIVGHAGIADPLLLVALAYHESSFDAGALNGETGAAGLFQLMPVHWANSRAGDPFDVETSATIGAKLLRSALRACATTEEALSRYNGRGCRPSRWARRVLKTWRRLARFRPVES